MYILRDRNMKVLGYYDDRKELAKYIGISSNYVSVMAQRKYWCKKKFKIEYIKGRLSKFIYKTEKLDEFAEKYNDTKQEEFRKLWYNELGLCK